MDVPEGIKVNVVENNESTVHITLPVAPGNHAELSDEELATAVGGTVETIKLQTDILMSELQEDTTGSCY